jgi:hypothetical protein
VKPRRTLDRIAVALLSLAVFVLGHDLLFLLTGGANYRAVLAASGHGSIWDITAMTVAGAAAGLTGLGLRRLLILSRLTRGLGPMSSDAQHGVPSLLRQTLRLWATILPIALLILVANENLERAAIGVPLPGFGIIVAAGPIFAAVALAVAIVAALYGWRRDLLVSRLVAADRTWERSPSVPYPHLPWVDRRPGSIAGRRLAGRAPPSMAFGR